MMKVFYGSIHICECKIKQHLILVRIISSKAGQIKARNTNWLSMYVDAYINNTGNININWYAEIKSHCA